MQFSSLFFEAEQRPISPSRRIKTQVMTVPEFAGGDVTRVILISIDMDPSAPRLAWRIALFGAMHRSEFLSSLLFSQHKFIRCTENTTNATPVETALESFSPESLCPSRPRGNSWQAGKVLVHKQQSLVASLPSICALHTCLPTNRAIFCYTT